MYKINNIELINYGIHPARAENSNIALEGFLDMPARLGKTHHDWSDELGTEPYVLAEEIRHGGRTITLHCYLQGSDRADAIKRVQELYLDFSQFTDLVKLSSVWGDFQVYIKDEIKAEYLKDGWVKMAIPFREPVVTINETLPTTISVDLYNIDGIDYGAFGAFVSKIEDNFNRPKTKEPNFTAYATEGYQVTKMAPMEIIQHLVFHATDFATVQSNVNKYHKLLASPGTRWINIDNMERECFNIDGFKVSGIRVYDQLALCEMEVKLKMVGAGIPVEPQYLLDNYGNAILGGLDFIQVDKYPLDFLLDNDGNRIITEKFKDIIL